MKTRLIVLLLSICAAAGAQYTRGYVFVAPGGVSTAGNTQATYQVGGGVERLLDRGIGAGAELGGVVPGHGLARNTAGIFSLNGYYHFQRDRKIDPYATLGYSLLFRDFTANLFNFGGGVNYWFLENLGLTVGFRDHVWQRGPLPNQHYWGFRIGLTFR